MSLSSARCVAKCFVYESKSRETQALNWNVRSLSFSGDKMRESRWPYLCLRRCGPDDIVKAISFWLSFGLFGYGHFTYETDGP